MKIQNKYFASIFLALTLMMGWVTPAYAADVLSVTPGTVYNDSSTVITVAGTGFDNTAVVLLNGYALTTTFLNDQTLTAVVPAGFSANTYAVTVTMTSAVVTGSATLNVLAPDTPTPTATVPTPTPTSTPPIFSRPQLVISSYTATAVAQTGKGFKINIGFNNVGSQNAVNAQAVFTSSDVVPTNTGGVQVLGSIASSEHVDAIQTFYTSSSTSGKNVVQIDVTLTYYNESGTPYSDKFTLSVPAKGGSSGGGGGGGGGGGIAYPTSTPTGGATAQLVITSYKSTVDPLQPGEQFQLSLTVQNMGSTVAKNVTMIMGGGSSGTGSSTPQPGGVSGSSGEFTNFAPVGTSNIQSLGNLAAGGIMQVSQNLVVNVSTNPGAYPMKITFSYVNSRGEVVNDDQVITLLVLSLPNLDVSFYTPPETFFMEQPAALPIQIVNLGKRTAVLGNMKIETKDGTIDPASALVGSLDPGGYFTFDSSFIPNVAGPMELTVTIDYTDDFNQPRSITKTLEVVVEESFIDPMTDPTMNGMDTPLESDESFLNKVWRFVLGLFGLDSAAPANNAPVVDPSFQEMPIPAGGGGKGG